jgi:folate-binding protein YgfZ|nr:ygfZ-like protein [uncultured bacterium]
MNQLTSSLGNTDGHYFTPNSVTSSRPARTYLVNMALIQIQGPDSERFLQGQLTCDVSALKNDMWQLGACCTAKGRMVANFLIARHNDDFWLRLPTAQASALQTHLSKYAVFFKTKLVARQDWLVLAELEQDSTPQAAHTVIADTDGISLQWPDNRREFWCNIDQADTWLTGHPLCSSKDWHLADIEAGLVWVNDYSREEWVPQHIDWQQHQGVSFSKGCYTGQEIVARLQYLGKSKRVLYRLSVPANTDIKPMTTINNNDGKAIGELASICQGQSHTEALAVINAEEQEIAAVIDEKPVTLHRVFYTENSDS